MSADAFKFLLALLAIGNTPALASAGGPAPAAPTSRPVVAAPVVTPAGPPANAAAATECAGAVAGRVQTRFGAAHDLAARFTQRSESAAYPVPQVSSGSVEFAKPGKMRWHYETPQASLVVSDGETMWIVDPTAKEVQLLPVDQGFLSGTPLHVLLDGDDLQDVFELTARDCDTDAVTLRLVPREAATYESLELTVDPATGDVGATRLADLLGTVTTVEFSELRLNPGLASDRFVYVPSSDERVLKLEN